MWIAALGLIAGIAAGVPFVMAGRAEVQQAQTGVGPSFRAQR